MERADENAARGLTIASAVAPVDAKVEPLSSNYSNAVPESPLDLTLEGPVERSALEAIGVEVNTQAGGMTTARAPIGLLPQLLTVPGVTRIAASAPVYPMLDVSAQEIDADNVWGAKPPSFTGKSGKNVVVGIVDTGIDINHADFKDATGHTRIKWGWNQTQALGTKPVGFTYGAEYTESQIQLGTAVLTDLDGHGTHVAGIACGNGRATGNGQPAYQYVGIAPEADIVVVQIGNTESGIVDGVNYVFQKAAAMGKKAVVNVSWSSGFGPRDGSYSLDQGISALCGPGKLVAAAAGNFGNIGVHGRCNLTTTGATTTVQFIVPAYTPSTLDVEYVAIEGWHDLGGAFDAKLTSPSGIVTPLVSPGGNSGDMQTTDGRIWLENDIQVTSKAKRIYVYLHEYGTTVPKAGTWTLQMTRRSGSSTGICDFWVSTWRLGTTTSPSFTGPALDQTHTVTSPATADSVISCGAYATKVRWTSRDGGTSLYSGSPPLWTVANFSSQGPRRDGVQRPDLVAPGYGVSSTLAATVAAQTSPVWIMPDGVHRIRYGTSMAAAHLTGALALMLQGDPGLTPSKARLTLRSQAKVDTYTGAVPNISYGYGKLDLVASGTTGVDEAAIAHFAFSAPFPNPSATTSSFQFTIPSTDLKPTNHMALEFVDVRGRMVRSITVPTTYETQRITWDGKNADGSRAPSGVYFARLVVNDQVAVRKFVRTDM
jgi:subtilisin family serine protease